MFRIWTQVGLTFVPKEYRSLIEQQIDALIWEQAIDGVTRISVVTVAAQSFVPTSIGDKILAIAQATDAAPYLLTGFELQNPHFRSRMYIVLKQRTATEGVVFDGATILLELFDGLDAIVSIDTVEQSDLRRIIVDIMNKKGASSNACTDKTH